MSETSGAAAPASSIAISIGGVFNRTFSVLFANLAPFLIISFLLAVPVLLFNLSGAGITVEPAAIGVGYFVVLLVSLVATYAAMGMMVYGTVAYLRGQPAGLGLCVSRGLSVIVSVILVGIVVSFLIMLGLIAVFVPGIFVIVLTAVAVPAAVVEKPGIWGSVKRSAELTKGNRWRVFALLLIFYLAMMGIGWGLTFAGLPLMRPDGTVFAAVAQFIWSGVTTAIFAVFGAVLYHDLRVAKEGVNTAQIAAVFD